MLMLTCCKFDLMHYHANLRGRHSAKRNFSGSQQIAIGCKNFCPLHTIAGHRHCESLRWELPSNSERCKLLRATKVNGERYSFCRIKRTRLEYEISEWEAQQHFLISLYPECAGAAIYSHACTMGNSICRATGRDGRFQSDICACRQSFYAQTFRSRLQLSSRASTNDYEELIT